jgi:hypothetical protein
VEAEVRSPGIVHDQRDVVRVTGLGEALDIGRDAGDSRAHGQHRLHAGMPLERR